MQIRSGRFKTDDATDGIVIIKAQRAGVFYRIMNSGQEDFNVDAGGGLNQPVKPGYSIDVVVSTRVQIETDDPVEIEGVYEYLNTDRPIRSGRFRNKLAADGKHKIIDLNVSGGQKPIVYYRIFNSGENDFEVWSGDNFSQDDNKIATVKPDQSFDFEISNQSGAKRDIFVKPLGTATEEQTIEGIYDFLGQRG